MLGDEIRSAAGKAGALTSAQEDLILRAKGIFQINDEGQAVAVDEDGNPIMGKDGRTPLSPIEWIESLKESAPHLFPQPLVQMQGNINKVVRILNALKCPLVTRLIIFADTGVTHI